MTKGDINRLGRKLAEEDRPSKENLKLLQEYRMSYRDVLSLVNKEIQELLLAIDKKAVVTYRVKRIESIISKMKRNPKMELSRVQDIAGIRCIMTNDEKVYRLVDCIKQSKKFNIKREFDYISNPKENGYKSFHLIVNINGKDVEIQIRSDYQHGWATLVEITDQIFKTKIKEYDDDQGKNLGRLLLLLSKSKDLTQDEVYELIKVFHSTNFILKITNVFCRNAPYVIEQLNKIKDTNGKFYLFEVAKNNKSKIKCYETFDAAENEYFAFKENENISSNIVMAYCEEKSIDAISKGYFNYILIQHTFYDDFKNILSSKTVIDSEFQDKIYYYYKLLEVCSELVKQECKNQKQKGTFAYKNKSNWKRSVIDFYIDIIFSKWFMAKNKLYKMFYNLKKNDR